MYYACDPEKAVECKRTTCYMNGGNCYLTSNPEYALDKNKPYLDSGCTGAYYKRKKFRRGGQGK